MEKLTYVLWRPAAVEPEPWSAVLRGEVATAIAAAGAHGIQVNVADDAVAPASIRMSTFDAPIEAVVSVWVDTSAGATRAAIEAALAPQAARLAGYLVTESVPLAAPATEPGSRTAGLANLAFLRRPAELDREEWLDRWQGSHTSIALETQSTFGYVQNVVVRPLTDDAPAIDGIVEELFPEAAMTDFHVFFDTGGSNEELGRRMTAMTTSVAHFSGEDALLDVAPTSRYVVSSPF
ncbi:EthD domain-containing protein [soil metagenome]